MFCFVCGANIEDGAAFCPKCGAPIKIDPKMPSSVKASEQEAEKITDLPTVCPNCGFVHSAGLAFCPRCGMKNEPVPRSPEHVAGSGFQKHPDMSRPMDNQTHKFGDDFNKYASSSPTLNFDDSTGFDKYAKQKKGGFGGIGLVAAVIAIAIVIAFIVIRFLV